MGAPAHFFIFLLLGGGGYRHSCLTSVLLHLDSYNMSSERHLQIKCVINITVMIELWIQLMSVLLPFSDGRQTSVQLLLLASRE